MMADDTGDMATQEASVADTSGAGSIDVPGRDAKDQSDRGLAAALAAALWETDQGDVDPLPTDVSALLAGQGSLGSSMVTAAPVHDPYDPSLPPTLARAEGWTPDDPTVRLPVVKAPAVVAITPVFDPPDWLLDRLDELLRLEQRHADHVSTLLGQTETRTEELVRIVMEPLLLGLARLADRMTAMDDPTAELLRIQLLQILDVSGVAPFTPEVGERFDASQHRGVSPVSTDDPTLDGRIAKVLSPGWRQAGGRLVRVADVEVHRLRADAQQEPSSRERI
jgi:hypothetical protein